jgi:pimeloyl-ACP methyl ester carboxylesterase
LWGEADRLVPPVYAEEFRARLVNAPVQVQVVPGAGHLLPLEQTATFVQAVRAFLG